MGTIEDWCLLPDQSIEEELCAMSARLAAQTARFLLAIGEYDQRRGWEAWECHDMASWLSWKCAISPVTARQQVRVARSLRDMPLLAERFAAGQLSYSQVRAIARAATPETVESFIDFAGHCTAAQLETITRAFRRSRQAAEETAEHRQRNRYLRYHLDDDGNLVGSFRVPAEAGSILAEAIDEATEAKAIQEADSEQAKDPKGAAAVDALIDLVTAGIQAIQTADNLDTDTRYLLQVIVEASILEHPDTDYPAVRDTDCDSGLDSDPDFYPASAAITDPAGVCQVADGPGLSAHTARRVACDATVVTITQDTNGHLLNLGRKRRTISRLQKIALHRRDRHCQYPGCSRTRTHGHHIIHWADGGPTNLSNLISLCSHHHHLLHEGRYTITTKPDQPPTFTRPDGQTIPTVALLPPPGPQPDYLDDVPPYHSNWEGDRLDLPTIIEILHQFAPTHDPTTT